MYLTWKAGNSVWEILFFSFFETSRPGIKPPPKEKLSKGGVTSDILAEERGIGKEAMGEKFNYKAWQSTGGM